jgi:hypothetical protein
VIRDGDWPVREVRLESGRFDEVFRQITTAPAPPAAGEAGHA